MLKWSGRSVPAIRKLFEPLQDIDVYVEDENDEAFYRSLLNFATDSTVRIARVFSLGNRSAVLQAAASHDQTARPALFIVDGDLSWVKGEPISNVLGLHCHEAYCIENLLLCEQALSTILSQERILTVEEAKMRLGYQQWRTSVAMPLLELFAAFATVHDFNPSVATVSIGVGVMCNPRSTKGFSKLDPAKVRIAKDAALTAAKASADARAVQVRYDGILSRITSLSDPLLTVSGKDFLLPLIEFHLQSLDCRIKKKSLRLRLATSGNRKRFSRLASALVHAARGFQNN